MSEGEKIHSMTENIYRNLLDNFNPGIRQLVTLGRAYQKALHNTVTAAKSYIECIAKLAHSAQVCKGATTELGAALLQIAEVHKEINTQVIDNIKAFHADLLIPIETKQESEFKHITLLYKKYSAGHKYHFTPFEKAQINLKKQKKKAKAKFGFDEKEIQYSREVKESQVKLDEYRFQGLKTALLEERKRYCFLLERICAMVRNYASHHSKAHELLTHRLHEWSNLYKQPHVLPESSESLLHSLRIQEDVYNMPDEDLQQQSASATGSEYDKSNPNMDRHSLTYGGGGEYGGSQQQSVPGMDPNSITVASQPAHMRPQVRAMYTHSGTGDTQLSFGEGDIVALIGEKRDGWQYGENLRTNRMGWFPISFTQTMDTSGHHQQSNMYDQRVHSLSNLAEIPDDYGGQDSVQMRDHRSNTVNERPRTTYGDSLLQVMSSNTQMQYGCHNNGMDEGPSPVYQDPQHTISRGMARFQTGSMPDVNMLGNPHHHHHHHNHQQFVPPPNVSVPPPPPPPPLPNQNNRPMGRPAPPLNHSSNNPVVKPITPHGPRKTHFMDSNQHGHMNHMHHGGHQNPQNGINYGQSHNQGQPNMMNGYSSSSPSPPNSSSGYSGSSNRQNQTPSSNSPFNQGLYGMYGGFPPPPPDMLPPAVPSGNYSDHEDVQRNPFANVRLKKAMTNDRSAPRIY